MNRERDQQYPEALENQEQFNRHYRVDDEKRKGHPRKHLRTRQGHEKRVTAQVLGQFTRLLSVAASPYS